MPIRRPATPSACTCRIRKSSPRIKPGDALLIDDGKLRLVATEVTPHRIVTQVEVGGKVSNRKGVSLPDTVVPLAALAPKDIADLEAALDAGVDWIALSFIHLVSAESAFSRVTPSLASSLPPGPSVCSASASSKCSVLM